MKWTSLTYHLALAGVVFSVQTASCFATSAADIFNFKKSVETNESKAVPFEKDSKDKKGNEKGETDTSPKTLPKKRGLHFVKDFQEKAIIREFTADGIPIIESPTSIDPDNYILSKSNPRRKKQGATETDGRRKREPRLDIEEDEEMDILKMMDGNHRNHHHNRFESDDDMEWDEEKIAAVSDEAANAVFEALGFGKNAGKYWPDGPPSTANLVPIAKIRIPFVRRPTL